MNRRNNNESRGVRRNVNNVNGSSNRDNRSNEVVRGRSKEVRSKGKSRGVMGDGVGTC